jgi:hypothetical protein
LFDESRADFGGQGQLVRMLEMDRRVGAVARPTASLYGSCAETLELICASEEASDMTVK